MKISGDFLVAPGKSANMPHYSLFTGIFGQYACFQNNLRARKLCGTNNYDTVCGKRWCLDERKCLRFSTN